MRTDVFWRNRYTGAYALRNTGANQKRRDKILSKGGGYIVAPAHNIQDNTRVENTLALFEAVTFLPERRPI
jgi:hypothetical protein